MNQSNTFDRKISEAMHYRRWIVIKAYLKQNEFWTEKTRGVEGYDPIQKYRLVWDVMMFNMNQIIEKGGLDLTMDETMWPNSSYADVHGRLSGKKTDKGGQHVLLLDARRQYMYAWSPRHRFFAIIPPIHSNRSGRGSPDDSRHRFFAIIPPIHSNRSSRGSLDD